LSDLAKRTLAIITTVKGASEPQMEITTGVPELLLEVRRDQLDRYGLNVSDIQELTEVLIGQKQVSEVIEGQQRFPLALSLPDSQRQNVDALAGIWLSAPGGERVRLDQVASVKVSRGPEIISRENARRRVVVQSNVRGTDLGSFVAAARQKVEQNMKLPAGYSMEWGGQFENQHRANQRLMIVLPVSILIIFGLLFATFHNVKQALLILLNVPFALVGGIAALWLRGLNLNLSASIGFIALFGVAVLNGIVMVSHINALREQGKNLKDAIKEGAADRLRPVLMTALVASLGFVPMAISQARGSEVQRPLATVVIGGLFTATILTLYLLPVLYRWFSPKEQVGVNPPDAQKQTQDQQLELVGQS
jgi:cobalt-zinc-cadmium resistance protein CzcA